MQKIFPKFPKIRPTLPDEIKKIYKEHYKKNRDGKTAATFISKKLESWMHKMVASDLKDSDDKSTLEIGAGSLNQLEYEPIVSRYNIIEPFKELYENSKLLGRIRNIYLDIDNIPTTEKFDRITSVATFEHICDLPKVVAKSGLFLNDNGTLRAAIPSEGTILWHLGWKFTTGLEFRLKYKQNYGLLIKHEHVNTAAEISEILKYFFNQVSYKVFGLTKGLSLYQFFECSKPNTKKCTEYLNQILK